MTSSPATPSTGSHETGAHHAHPNYMAIFFILCLLTVIGGLAAWGVQLRDGLGVTGLADALLYCRARYGSEEAVRLTETWMSTLRRAAYAASVEIAKLPRATWTGARGLNHECHWSHAARRSSSSRRVCS